MKSYSDQIDDRYYSILEEEFDLASELQRLRDAKKYALADTLRVFMAALTALPPRWSEAIALGFMPPPRNRLSAGTPMLDHLLLRNVSPKPITCSPFASIG